MAKKNRKTKRSTMTGKGRPSTKRVAAKRKSAVFQPGVFQPGVFQGLLPSASKRKLSPAVRSTVEEGQTTRGTAPVPVTPTVYPDSPQAIEVTVQNHVRINLQSEEFRRFSNNIEALISELRVSNEISGEVKDKLISELSAGRGLLAGPKPQRGLIDLLLVSPLKWLIEKSGSAIIGKLAGDALDWLLKMLP
jgi:hypothetical protein